MRTKQKILIGIRPSNQTEIRFETSTIIKPHIVGDKIGKNSWLCGFSEGLNRLRLVLNSGLGVQHEQPPRLL